MAYGGIRYNGSGYRDDTAFQAICSVAKQERKARHGNNRNKGNRDIAHFDSDRLLDSGDWQRDRYASELARVNRGVYQVC